MFNSGQILADLVTLGADLKGVVWFGDVFEYEVPNGPDGVPDPSETYGMSTVEGKVLKPDEDALEDWEEKFKGIMENKWKEEGYPPPEEIKKIKKKRAHVYTGLELCEQMYLRNCHRLTEDMVSRKIEGWKAICKRHSEDLIAYWSNRYEAQVALREEQQVQQKEVEKNRALRKASMLTNPNKKGIDAKKGKDAEKMEEEEEEEENDDDGKKKTKKWQILKPFVGMKGRIRKFLETEAEAREIQPTTYKKPGRKPLKLMTKRNMALGWRDHGLYHKVMGEPYVFSSEVTERQKYVRVRSQRLLDGELRSCFGRSPDKGRNA